MPKSKGSLKWRKAKKKRNAEKKRRNRLVTRNELGLQYAALSALEQLNGGKGVVKEVFDNTVTKELAHEIAKPVSEKEVEELRKEVVETATEQHNADYVINGVPYNGTQKEVAKMLSIAPATLKRRCSPENEKYQDWVKN